jgi:predicted metal-dependent hydrolase
MITVTFKELTLEVRRSTKRRTVGITVERDGQLIITAPPDIPLETLEQIVESRSLWIYRHLLQKDSLNAPIVGKEYVTGEGFYYLGRSYRLKMFDGESEKPPLRLYRGRFYLDRWAQSKGREYFIEWYRTHLTPYLEDKIRLFANRIEDEPRSVQVRELSNRWGSCSQKRDLYFHWRVAMLPHTMIEYVVIHEMVHLIEHQHNDAFWRRVERILPDYRQRKRWLAENGCHYNL